MASDNPVVTSYRWEIANFYIQWETAFYGNKLLISDNFYLEHSSIQFAIFYKALDMELPKDKFGIVLKDAGGMKQIEFGLKIWLENEQGEKFGKRSVQKYTFNNVGDECEFDESSGNDENLLQNLCYNKESLFICCKVTHLNISLALSAFKDKFLQNQWSLFENGVHDSIIKVGNVEFKVLKSHFMAQSSVFNKMFLSKFKEGQTSTIVVKDVDEKTMNQLIKWIYSGQVDDQSVVESLFEAADKYDIKLLKEFCVQSMIATLDDSNAFERLIIAVLHNDDSLKNACLNQVAKMSVSNAFKCTSSTKWFELVKKNTKVAEEVTNLINGKLNE